MSSLYSWTYWDYYLKVKYFLLEWLTLDIHKLLIFDPKYFSCRFKMVEEALVSYFLINVSFYSEFWNTLAPC